MVLQRRLSVVIFALAISDLVAANAYAQSDACAEGFVWREAFAGDRVCVSPNTRDQVRSDNANAARRKAEKDECLEGFVWRLANPEDRVCAPQDAREQARIDNELAVTRLASRSPRPPSRSSTELPIPPARLGCRVFSAGEWRDIACATEEETKRMPRPVATIESRRHQVKFLGIEFPYRPAIKFAKFEIELLSDPALGSVNDNRPASFCPAPQDTALNSPDTFSVQVNTSYFDAGFGGSHSGWVQFVLQTSAGSDKDGLCVWKVDADKQGYDNSACVLPKRDRTFLGKGAEGRRNQSIQVIGLVQKSDDGTRMLTAVAGIPWIDGGLPLGSVYAVTTTDTVNGNYRGLGDNKEYPLGLGEADNWWQTSADIYGVGCGSRAEFKGVSFFQKLTVGTCNLFDTSCLSSPMNQFSLPYFAKRILWVPLLTAESNNLKGSLSNIQTPNFSCPRSTECVTWGSFHSP